MIKPVKYLLLPCLAAIMLFPSCRQALPSSSTAVQSVPAVKKPGDYQEKLLSGGRVRNYDLHVPPSYNGRVGMPLVIVLHGGGGGPQSIATTTGMSAKSDEAGFIVVYPAGTGPVGIESLLTWNAGNCCGYALDNNVDDVGFIRDMIDKLERELIIDPSRIYAAGFSNGGMMCYRLALELSDKIVAVAPVSGAMGVANPVAVNPESLIIFHGTADENVLYNGGAPLRQIDTHPRVDRPVSYAVNFWTEFDGCSLSGNVTSGHIVKTTYSGGKNGTEVILYTIIGGGHAWPGGKPGSLQGDIPTQEISATDLIWDFFQSQHGR